MFWSTITDTAYLRLLPLRFLRFLFLFIVVIILFPFLRGTLLRFLSLLLIAQLLGGGWDVLLSYVTRLPGSLELLFILVTEVIETIELLRALKGSFGILDDLGSDAPPVTPRTIFWNVRSPDRNKAP